MKQTRRSQITKDSERLKDPWGEPSLRRRPLDPRNSPRQTTGCKQQEVSLLRVHRYLRAAEDLHALRLGRGSFIWKQAAEAGIQKQMHGYRDPIGPFKCVKGFT